MFSDIDRHTHTRQEGERKREREKEEREYPVVKMYVHSAQYLSNFPHLKR
jgi:hypothetical protein